MGANARTRAAHARWTPVFLVLLAVLLQTGHAGATAGLAEREAMCRSNTYSDLWWGHSDACSGGIAAFGKDCFRFEADTTQTLLHRVAMPDARAGRWMRLVAQERQRGADVSELWAVYGVSVLKRAGRPVPK